MANYYDHITPDLLDRVATSADGRPVVLKTHGDLHPEVAQRIAAGTVLASASIRDPREIALSMVDHGRRARNDREQAFSEVRTPLETLPSIDAQIGVFQRWAQVKTMQVFTYNQICFETPAVIQRVATQFGVTVDSDRVMAPFASKGMIGQFNIGVPQRYQAMDEAMQGIFLARYAAFYARMAFEQNASLHMTPVPVGAKRPASGLERHVADLRRLLRRLVRSAHIGAITPR